jgi:uncharacterized protein (DUF488 family)
MKIYTIGYCGRSPASILKFLEQVDGVAVDVRMVPRSYVASYNGSAFAKSLGARYRHVQEFGNSNYKNGGPIKVVDLAAGAGKLADLLASGKAVVLMCGCPDVSECHRKTVAEYLGKLWNCEVEHLTPPPKPVKSARAQQPTLF